jgi:hypothetical protein
VGGGGEYINNRIFVAVYYTQPYITIETTGRRSRKPSCLLCTTGHDQGIRAFLLVMINNGIPASVFPASLKQRTA